MREQPVAEVGTQDDQGSLGDVDHAHDPEGQRETAGHQRVDAARQEPEDACLDEEMHLLAQVYQASSYPFQLGFGTTGLWSATLAGYTGSSLPPIHSTRRSLPCGEPYLSQLR